MDSMRQERREFARWWMWLVGLIVVGAVVFGVLRYTGVFVDTVVERKVFENSYQRSEGLKTEIATYQAQIAELQGQLDNPQLDENTKANIKSQLAAIRIKLATARGRE